MSAITLPSIAPHNYADVLDLHDYHQKVSLAFPDSKWNIWVIANTFESVVKLAKSGTDEASGTGSGYALTFVYAYARRALHKKLRVERFKKGMRYEKEEDRQKVYNDLKTRVIDYCNVKAPFPYGVWMKTKGSSKNLLPLIENYDKHPDQGRPDIQAIYGFSAIKKSEIESTGNWATDTISSSSNFWLVILPDGSTGFETDSGRASWYLEEKQRFPVRGYSTPEDPIVPGSNVYFMNVFIDTWTRYPDVFGPWSSLLCCIFDLWAEGEEAEGRQKPTWVE